jgi:hypothetical protein
MSRFSEALADVGKSGNKVPLKVDSFVTISMQQALQKVSEAQN